MGNKEIHYLPLVNGLTNLMRFSEYSASAVIGHYKTESTNMHIDIYAYRYICNEYNKGCIRLLEAAKFK